jgi:hypothetical protein
VSRPTARERRFAGHLLSGFTNLVDGTRYDRPCGECHCEDCLPNMTKRGCCGLGRALREAAAMFARKPARRGGKP